MDNIAMEIPSNPNGVRSIDTSRIRQNEVLKKFYTKILSKENFNNVVIFGLSYCGYSDRTKKYAKKNNLVYKFYNIDKYYDIFFKLLKKLIVK